MHSKEKTKRQDFVEKIKLPSELLSSLKEEVEVSLEKSSALMKLREQIQAQLDLGAKGLIIELCPDHLSKSPFKVSHLRELSHKLGRQFGELLEQNEKGDSVISVYDRDRYSSMHQGARYHQTREGGSIHTDNVNVPTPWDYLLFTCLAPAAAGGENIFVNGLAIHEELKENYPDALKILQQDFIWEMRGVSDSLYRAPIISYNKNGEPLFRHLRPYMESAHKKAETPLTGMQLYALDTLDALTNDSRFQQRYHMKKGDILFTIDAQVFHGRTCFSDAYDTINIDEFMKGKPGTLKRTMERIWIRK